MQDLTTSLISKLSIPDDIYQLGKWDCYRLCKLVYEQNNLLFPDCDYLFHCGYTEESMSRLVVIMLKVHCEKVESPSSFDLAQLKLRGLHCLGVVVENKLIYMAEQAKIVDLSKAGAIIEGFWTMKSPK
jgi:hypothetical protein